MPDPQTANIGLAIPTRGTDTGTWDTPVNNNTTILDLIVGGTATIGLNNANVVLSAAQFECNIITFNSTLTGSVSITFPSTFTKTYTIQNLCTGSSAFIITLKTTNGSLGGNAIACPPILPFDVICDGSNLTFKNFGPPVGGYWDYAGSFVPSWVSNCTIPPYLNCDGTTFSASTYPALAVVLGSTTLPDFRGRVPGYLNQGTGRITSAGGGVDGNTISAAGGAQTNTIGSSNLPASIPYTDPGHQHTYIVRNNVTTASPGASVNIWQTDNNAGTTSVVTTGITINPGAANAAITNLPPMTISGLRLIRAG